MNDRKPNKYTLFIICFTSAVGNIFPLKNILFSIKSSNVHANQTQHAHEKFDVARVLRVKKCLVVSDVNWPQYVNPNGRLFYATSFTNSCCLAKFNL